MERRIVTLVAVLAISAPLLACGGGGPSFANRPPPPKSIVVTATIDDQRVSVSPRTFGAGPIELIVTNLTGDARDTTLESTGFGSGGTGIQQTTGPINPGDTARLQADLPRGRYAVRAEGVGRAPVRVTATRQTAQGELLQP